MATEVIQHPPLSSSKPLKSSRRRHRVKVIRSAADFRHSNLPIEELGNRDPALYRVAYRLLKSGEGRERVVSKLELALEEIDRVCLLIQAETRRARVNTWKAISSPLSPSTKKEGSKIEILRESILL